MQIPVFEKHIDYLFSAALKKCGNLEDAEDLTQEVLLAAIRNVSDAKEITDVRAWLSSVLNHKYYDNLRRKYKLPTVSIDLVTESDDSFIVEEQEDNPNDAEIRREVAYLAGLYREVIVRHYLLGNSVQKIADDLHIPRGTVLSRLSGGRKQIRKGFDEMERYEKQSYQPERLEVGCHGYPGLHDEPWSLVSDDLMKQNILIATYDKPLTCVEIARGLGIPTAYIEKAVNELVENQLMKRAGARVFADFMMTTPEQMLSVLDQQIAFAEINYPSLWAQIDNSLSKLENMAWFKCLPSPQQNKCSYYFLLHVFTTALYTATGRIVPIKEEFPQRPDGGNWIAVGNRYPLDFDFESYRFGKYCYGGERHVSWEKFLHSKSIKLYVYDTQPDLNKYEHGPVEMRDDNLCKLLYIIQKGLDFDDTGFNPMFLRNIPHLATCGVLKIENDKPIVDIPVLNPAQYQEMDELRIREMRELTNVLTEPLREIFPKFKLSIPAHLQGRVAEFRKYACYAIPMATIKRAVANGDFLKDIGYSCPPMVLVIDK